MVREQPKTFSQERSRIATQYLYSKSKKRAKKFPRFGHATAEKNPTNQPVLMQSFALYFGNIYSL